MDGKAWHVVAVSLLTGLTIGLPGVGQAAGDEDETAVAAMFEDGPARPEQPFRVEWVARPGRFGRSRLTGSVHNEHGQTALNVQLRISEIDAAGQTVSSVIGPTLESVPGQSQAHFDVQVPDNHRAYRVAVASFSFNFAELAAR
jgi:hypothetical protein